MFYMTISFIKNFLRRK